MPMYTYQIVHKDGSEGEIFSVLRSMSDPPLEHHPETGEKVVRVFQVPHLAGWSHERLQKQTMDNKKLENLGFTKFVKNGKGHYERQAGNFGPSELHPGGS